MGRSGRHPLTGDDEASWSARRPRLNAHPMSIGQVLTLTATPIPRTLGMALEGLRDFSVIATAPQRRLAMTTLVGLKHARDLRPIARPRERLARQIALRIPTPDADAEPRKPLRP